jgi:hypothetical protein
MLSLTDEELDVLMNLSRPLEPQLRDPFLRSVATELERHLDLGTRPDLPRRQAATA